MIVRKCDKCGSEAPVPNAVTQITEHYEIFKVKMLGKIPIDLCNECQKQLESWIKGDTE